MLEPDSNTLEFYIKEDLLYFTFEKKLECVNLNDIGFVRAYGNYVELKFNFNGRLKSILLRITLSDFKKLISDTHLLNVHRSYLINTYAIEELHSSYVVISGNDIPVSRSKVSILRNFLAVI